VIDGIPILLRDDVEQTHWAAEDSLQASHTGDFADDDPKALDGQAIDPYVQDWIGATGGLMYQSVVNRLTEYPIPRIPSEPGNGRTLVDVGCNWGRWTIAAARRGYRPIGVDPSLRAVRAAKRVCLQLGIEANFVVGDARYLPFAAQSLDAAFSYSVIQHLSKADARRAAAEIGRVLKPGGRATVQMPNAFGVRCLYHQVRRRFREPRDFQVRYWTPRELRSAFAAAVGPASLTVDGFFSLNAQPAEAHLLPLRFRAVVRASEVLRRLTDLIPPLAATADSLYVRAVRARR